MTPEIKQRIDQIRRGEVPEGYKKTKIGIRPVDWDFHILGDCLCRVEKPVEVKPGELYTQIGIRSHGKGLFYKEPVTGTALGNKSVFWIEPDCFILNIVFAWEQAIGKTTQSEIGMIGSHRFPMYRPIENVVDVDYLILYFLTKRGTDILAAASPGGAGRNKTLGQDRFLKSKIVLPPVAEQRKIAAILTTQDKAIALQQRKIEELKSLKRTFLGKMFPQEGSKTPELRFKGFTGDWEQRKLSDLYSKAGSGGTPSSLNESYYNGHIPFLGISDIKDRYIYSTAKTITESGLCNSSAWIVPKGAICLAMYASVGKIGILTQNAATSQAFFNMVFKEESLRDFVYARLEKAEISQEWEPLISTGTQRNLNAKKVANFSISVPSCEEVAIIASFFRSLDDLITLHQRKLGEMEKMKKALMQLLLTGIVRVK